VGRLACSGYNLYLHFLLHLVASLSGRVQCWVLEVAAGSVSVSPFFMIVCCQWDADLEIKWRTSPQPMQVEEKAGMVQHLLSYWWRATNMSKHRQRWAPLWASLTGTPTTMVYYPSSFGDIVAAVTIVHTIYTALQDSRGSSFEYQCLIDDLRSFETALNTVHDILQKIPIDQSLRDPIIAEAKVCRTLLEGFLGRIQRYEVILSRRCTAIWRKVVWAIFKTKEVESFRLKLLQHKQNISTFLTALAM